MNNRLLLFLLVWIIVTLISPITAWAATPTPCPSGRTTTDLGCIPSDDPLTFASNVYGIGLGLIGSVGLLSIIYGGYLVLSSQGDLGQLQKGKSYIVYAIIGIVLAVSGFAFYQIIANDVLKIPGFN